MLISDKWKVLILRDLMPGTRRFGELKKSIGTVSQKVLTAQLRDMEAKGLVTRRVYAEVPPRVELSLIHIFPRNRCRPARRGCGAGAGGEGISRPRVPGRRGESRLADGKDLSLIHISCSASGGGGPPQFAGFSFVFRRHIVSNVY